MQADPSSTLTSDKPNQKKESRVSIVDLKQLISTEKVTSGISNFANVVQAARSGTEIGSPTI